MPNNAVIKHFQETATILKHIFMQSVESVKPHILFKNKISLNKNILRIDNENFPLSSKRCFMVGFGKAVGGMAIEIAKILNKNLNKGIVIVPNGIFDENKLLKPNFDNIEFIEGAANNLPDQAALNGALKIHKLIQQLQSDDLLIVLISGGGSALLPLPIHPITLEQKMDLIKNLSRAGATIQELNTIRKHLSILKGGGLAKIAHPTQVVSLILSDVIGDPLDIIASGPTVPFLKDPDRVVQILKKYNLYDSTPNSVKTVLNNESFERDDFTNVTNILIGTNRIATAVAKQLAIEMGYQSVVLSHQVEGNVNEIAELYALLMKAINKRSITNIRKILENLPFRLEDNVHEELLNFDFSKKIFLILAGEPIVIVKGNGKGGRNQQLALKFSTYFTNNNNNNNNGNSNIVFLSGGTDGIDGPTDAAGAIVSNQFAKDCYSLGINIDQYLENNDSYCLLSKYPYSECLLKIGHTGTNVMDLHFLIYDPEN